MGRGHWLNFFMRRTKDDTNNYTKEELIALLDKSNIPKHVAIIMDGNGRWAKKRGLPRLAGHRAGIEPIRRVVRIAQELGIKHITLYAFSTENWKRSNEEVSGLMKILQEFLGKEALKLHEKNVKITTIGQIDRLPNFAYQELQKSMTLTENNNSLTLNLALNYGGRDEIIKAAKKLAKDIQTEQIKVDDINDELFAKYLFTEHLPDPELLIRTSGELRLSNFLLWQVAYTEFWVTSTYWPDFQQTDFLRAILAYQKRDRRFGGVNL